MTVQHSQPGRLGPVFASCHEQGRAALIGYLPTGYPDVATSIDAMVALVESGCDIVEVGVPYSDPGMDGPVIATATDVALHAGVRVRDTLHVVEAISAAGGSAVVMTYWNPVLHYGVDAWARDLAAAGGLGMITPDLIPDEASAWIAASGSEQKMQVAPRESKSAESRARVIGLSSMHSATSPFISRPADGAAAVSDGRWATSVMMAIVNIEPLPGHDRT